MFCSSFCSHVCCKFSMFIYSFIKNHCNCLLWVNDSVSIHYNHKPQFINPFFYWGRLFVLFCLYRQYCSEHPYLTFIFLYIILRVSLSRHLENGSLLVLWRAAVPSHCKVALKIIVHFYTHLYNSACLPISSSILRMIWFICFVTWMAVVYHRVIKIFISLMTTEINFQFI